MYYSYYSCDRLRGYAHICTAGHGQFYAVPDCSENTAHIYSYSTCRSLSSSHPKPITAFLLLPWVKPQKVLGLFFSKILLQCPFDSCASTPGSNFGTIISSASNPLSCEPVVTAVTITSGRALRYERSREIRYANHYMA